MKIIFNADDFGLTKGVNLGILESFHNGVVRSTTLMTNQPAFDHAILLAKETKGLGVGVHLVLTAGSPLVSGLKTLVDENGSFLKNADVFAKAKEGFFDLDEVEKEYTAQIEKMIQAGCMPTHIDGHHHTHALPHIYEVTSRLAKKYDLPVRVQKKSDAGEGVQAVDEFFPDFYADHVSLDFLTDHIQKTLDRGLHAVEYMTHTAYVDAPLLACTSYALPRVKEMEVMTSQGLRDFLADRQIDITSYGALFGRK